MTYHMMWGHSLRLWKKELEEWWQGAYIWYIHLIVYTWYTYWQCMDIRVGLFIISMDHVSIV